MCDAQFAAWLCECVARPVERHSRESTIALEAARLLLNLAIINTDTMHVRRQPAQRARQPYVQTLLHRLALTCAALVTLCVACCRLFCSLPATGEHCTTCCALLKSAQQARSRHSPRAAPQSDALHPLVAHTQSLRYLESRRCAQEEQHSLDVAFLVARVLVFMCINPHLRLLFEQERLLSILVSAVLSHTASPAALASTRASSPASTPVVSPRQSGGVQSAALQRQLVAELVKLLCHLCMDDQGHALQQAVTNDTFHEFGERIVALLSLNVTIPQQTALLLARPTLSNTDATETQLDDIHVDESPSAAITAAADTATALAPTSAASTPSSATSPSSPSRQQRDQTRLALQDMREEAEEAAASEQPQSVSVRQLKREIADCLIYLPAHLASFLEDDIKAVQALVLILHRNLLTAREDAKSEENVLTPIVSSLTGLAVESRNIRRYIKTAIFQEAALLSPSTESTPAAVMSMVPAGSVNEQQLDVDPLSLRSLLLPYCTSIKFRVKAAVSELLFQLCDAQANDFIRLCGLGNAIGLLAEKGLPGFTGLTQQALSLDALMAAKKSSGS